MHHIPTAKLYISLDYNTTFMRCKPLLLIAMLFSALAIALPAAIATQNDTYDYYGPDNVIARQGDYIIMKHAPPDAIGDTSGADGTITFWQLPLWIQLTKVTEIAVITAAALALILKLWPVVIGKLRTPRDNEIRDQIYRHIKNNPGTTMADIARKEDLNLGTVRYHVGQLQSAHRINLVRSDKFVRLFQNSGVYSEREKTVLSAINRPTAMALVSYLHDHPGTTGPEIAGYLQITDSGAYVQLKKLLRDQVIRAEPAGRFLRYYLREDVKALIDRQSSV